MHTVLYQQHDCLLPRKASSSLDKTPARTDRPGLTPQKTLSGQPKGKGNSVTTDRDSWFVSILHTSNLEICLPLVITVGDLKNTPNEGKSFEAAPVEAKLLSHGKQQGQR